MYMYVTVYTGSACFLCKVHVYKYTCTCMSQCILVGSERVTYYYGSNII